MVIATSLSYNFHLIFFVFICYKYFNLYLHITLLFFWLEEHKFLYVKLIMNKNLTLSTHVRISNKPKPITCDTQK